MRVILNNNALGKKQLHTLTLDSEIRYEKLTNSKTTGKQGHYGAR